MASTGRESYDLGQPSKEVKQAWLEANKHKRPEINRKSRLRREYGITPEQHDQMLVDQNGNCAICKEPFADSTPYVDHDHSSRWVRGLLCTNCNTGIGFFSEDIHRMQAAIEYLVSNATPTEFNFCRVPNPKRKHTDAWKQAASERHKGNKYRLGTPAWNKGIPWPEGIRKKMSDSAIKQRGRGGN